MMGVDADLMIEPGLQAGVGIALTGNPGQVGDKIRHYGAMNVFSCMFSGSPPLEEARRFGELVMPLLRGKQQGCPTIHTDRSAPVSQTPDNKREASISAAPPPRLIWKVYFTLVRIKQVTDSPPLRSGSCQRTLVYSPGLTVTSFLTS